MKKAITRAFWKDLVFEDVKQDMYEINNFGDVRNKITGTILTPREINTGYMSVNLRCNDNKGHNKLQHRLVAHAFIKGKRIEEDTVDHIDGNKKNNEDTNLHWCTQEENNKLAIKNGQNNILGSNHHMAKLTEEKVHIICKMIENNISYEDILKEIGLENNDNNRDMIGNIKRGISWKHISCQYDFSNVKYNNSKFTDDQIHHICKMLENQKSLSEIYYYLYKDKYLGSRIHKKFYEFIRLIKNRKSFTYISKNYNF